MIRLNDLTGPAKDLCIDQWLRGCRFAVISVANPYVGRRVPYFASSHDWTEEDAEEVARSVHGFVVDLRGEPMATSADAWEAEYACGADLESGEPSIMTSADMADARHGMGVERVCGDDGDFCSRECVEEHAGGCGVAL